MSSKRGFSLAEVLLALGMAAVVVLALLELGIALLATNRKTIDVSAAQLVAEGELQRAIYQATGDATDSLWSASPGAAFKAYPVRLSGTDYQVALYSEALLDVGGSQLGGSTSNQARRVEVLVSWWTGERSGYGRLQTRNSRVVTSP